MAKRLKYRLICAAALLFFTLNANGSTPPVNNDFHYAGEYSNMRHTEEHAYGYSVQLWRSGNDLIGFLLVSDGLEGDTPTGMLENVHYDSATGALSFDAKLTTGEVYLGEGKQVPAHDFFSFQGTLQPKEKILSGTLTHVDKLQADQKPTVERVRLRRMKDDDSGLEAKTLEEWKSSAKDILSFRGPKW